MYMRIFPLFFFLVAGVLLSGTGCKYIGVPSLLSYRIKQVEWYVPDPSGTSIDTFRFAFRMEDTNGNDLVSAPEVTRATVDLPYTMDVNHAPMFDMNTSYLLTFVVKDGLFNATVQEAFTGSAFAPKDGSTETTLDVEANTMRAKVTFVWEHS